MSRLALSISDRTELAERLALAGRVLKLQWVVDWALRALAFGLLADCLWLAGARFLPYRVQPPLLLIAPAVLALLGALVAALWPMADGTVARRADRDLGLKERLVTAVELQRRPAGSALAALQLRDAVEQLRRYEPLDAFPLRLRGRDVNTLFGLALLAIALVLVPNPMEQTVRQREQVQATIKQEAERIDKLADDLAAQEDPQDFADVQDALRAASSALQERQLSPDQATAALQRIEQQMLARQDPSTGELEDALSALAGSLAQEPTTRDLGASLARGDVRQAASELRRLGSEADSLSPADRAKLAQSLRQAASRTARSNSALSQALQRSADALESGQPGEAAGALSQAADQLENAAGPLRAASQRERALSQLQESRGAINRSQQAAQARGNGNGTGQGQRGQGQQAEAGQPGASPDEAGGAASPGDQPGAGDQPGGSSAGTGEGGHDEMIYDPLATTSTPDFVPGQEPFDPNQAFQSEDPQAPYSNQAQVGYKQVYAQYQERATQALQNSYIPAGMKDIVKDYFSSLAPDK